MIVNKCTAFIGTEYSSVGSTYVNGWNTFVIPVTKVMKIKIPGLFSFRLPPPFLTWRAAIDLLAGQGTHKAVALGFSQYIRVTLSNL